MSDLDVPAPGNLPPEDPWAAIDRGAEVEPGTSAGEGTGLGGLGTSAATGATDNGTGAGQGTGAAGPGTTAGGGSDSFGPPEVSGIGSGYGGQVSSAGPTGVPDATREAAATTLDGGMADLQAGAGLPEGEWQAEEAGVGVEPPGGAQGAASGSRTAGGEGEPGERYSEDETDLVTDASMDSFPASDPPSYTPHRS